MAQQAYWCMEGPDLDPQGSSEEARYGSMCLQLQCWRGQGWWDACGRLASHSSLHSEFHVTETPVSKKKKN